MVFIFWKLVLILNSLQNVGNSQREYEKLAVAFSVKNQLRYKGNLGMLCSSTDLLTYELLVLHAVISIG